MKNFYLVQASLLYGDTYYLPYATGMLAAYAMDDPIISANYNFRRFIFTFEDIDETIGSMENPALVGFSCSIWNYEYNLEFAKKLKSRYPECVILFGGHHVPPTLSYLEKYNFIDLLSYGKGEEAFRDILLAIIGEKNYTDIPNIAFREDGIPTKTRTQALHGKEYPSPYLTGLFDNILSDKNHRYSCVLETNRGCPFNCAYCDWGELGSQVRQFPFDRVLNELNWMAENKMEFVYLVDANFGMFERDEVIAQHLVQLKNRYGYPNRLQVSYAKNSPDRVFRINKLLSDNNIGKGATLAIQSLSPEVLKNVHRINIDESEYIRRIEQFREAGISTYTELIIGLPGETYDSFCKGLCRLLELGQHSSVSAYHCELLPGSEMAQPAFRDKYGIKTVCTALDQFHCEDMSHIVSGYSDIVVATNTMSVEDWVKANYFSSFLQGFHHFGLTQAYALFVNNDKKISYYDFYTSLLAYVESNCRFINSILKDILNALHDFINGKSSLTLTDYRFGKITWPFEEAIFLKCGADKDRFYRELQPFVSDLIGDNDLYDDLTSYQKALTLWPGNDGTVLRCRHNFAEYFKGIYVGSTIPLQNDDRTYKFNTPFVTHDLPGFAREIVWYGRRNSRMLYSSEPNTIEVMQ